MGSEGAFVIFGSGGHALVLFELSQLLGFEPICFVDPFVEKATYLGLPLLSGIEKSRLEGVSCGLGIGPNYLRERAFLNAKNLNPTACFPVLVHPSAVVSPSARSEEGAVVLAQAHVGPGATVGIGALINSGASLDHQTRMGRFSSLGPRAFTAGGVDIGERAMIGMGASVFQKVSIGVDTVVGASSMVRSGVPANSVAFGTPATVVRARKIDDPYF